MHTSYHFTDTQVQEFHVEGFIVLKSFASSELCDAILEKAHEHLEKKIKPYESEEEYLQVQRDDVTLRRLRQVYQREEVFKSWMLNDAMHHIVRKLLKDDITLVLAHHNSIMTKMPCESSETSWHQDIRYWSYESDNLVSVWLSLDSEYLENGLLEFIPKSHTMKFSHEQFDEKMNFKDDIEKNQKIISQKVHTKLEKGDVVLFHARTLHHANKNSTLKPKISFVYTLKEQSNKAVKNTRSDAEEIIL